MRWQRLETEWHAVSKAVRDNLGIPKWPSVRQEFSTVDNEGIVHVVLGG